MAIYTMIAEQSWYNKTLHDSYSMRARAEQLCLEKPFGSRRSVMKKKWWLGLIPAGAALFGGYRYMRNRHYTLMSDAGEQTLSQREKGNSAVWKEYPRPQMKRQDWINLNGVWECNGQKIMVPFPPQSALSGYHGHVGERLMYRCSFTLPEQFEGKRILLHFGAVDQIAEVSVNGQFLAKHEGGYLAWTVDMTEAVRSGQKNELCVTVTDALSHDYPYGKQRKKRGGMWYTPVSGIWQSVWAEAVPDEYIRFMHITPDLKGINLKLELAAHDGGRTQNAALSDGSGMSDAAAGNGSRTADVAAGNGSGIVDAAAGYGSRTAGAAAGNGSGTPDASAGDSGADCPVTVTVRVTLSNGTVRVFRDCMDRQTLAQKGMRIELAGVACADSSAYSPRLWSPDSPHLYPMSVTVGDDTVESYFALRKIEIREIEGVQRVCLNGEPVFLHGVLDQGYYPEGIYLPGEEREYERDILRMKELGINMLRKHIKVEPECFYYYCDVHGMLVMQDMVNSGHYSFVRDTALPMLGMVKTDDRKRGGSLRRKQFFEQHMKDTLAQLYSHPCIIAYTIFNEGWGQFESDRMYETARSVDDTRLYDSTSGWFWQTKSDFASRHIYFKTMKLPKTERPLIVSECGGYAYTLPDHRYSRIGHYGYGECQSREELTKRIVLMYEKMIYPAIADGACGCVYTQLSDVEDETNGFYTYDRKVLKVDAGQIRQIADKLKEVLRQSLTESLSFDRKL